jgi:hypothetical protein
MTIRRAKKRTARRRRPAYLPLFAMMNPVAYEGWRPRTDHPRL